MSRIFWPRLQEPCPWLETEGKLRSVNRSKGRRFAVTWFCVLQIPQNNVNCATYSFDPTITITSPDLGYRPRQTQWWKVRLWNHGKTLVCMKLSTSNVLRKRGSPLPPNSLSLSLTHTHTHTPLCVRMCLHARLCPHYSTSLYQAEGIW